MTDLHEPRGYKPSRSLILWQTAALALFCTAYFVQGFEGPVWVERLLRFSALAPMFTGLYLEELRRRRWRSERVPPES